MVTPGQNTLTLEHRNLLLKKVNRRPEKGGSFYFFSIKQLFPDP